MTPEEERKIIANWFESALKLMQEHEVSLLPENYTVWFEYVRGSNKRLKETIDNSLKENKTFTHDLNRQIYNTHILREIDSKTIVESSQRVQNIMANVLKAVEAGAADTASYNSELDNFSREVEHDGNATAGEFKEIIGKIVSKTKELKEKGEILSQKLNESRLEVANLKTNLEEVSLQVSLDGLTGIANRKAFDEALLNKMKEARQTNNGLCLLFIDVDYFKKFNDTYGHLLGDQVLRIVAQSTKEMVKGKDFVARFGGEEFAVILPDTPLRGGEIVAESIRKAIAGRELKRKDTGESYGSVTVSIGVSTLRANDTAEDMISRADKALYESKNNGRNRVTSGE